MIRYNISEIVSDAYAGEWVTSEFRSHDITHRRADKNKSELYLEALPLFMHGAVRIPNHLRLIRELRLLERRTSRVGRDMIDAPRGISEDHANALCGALASLNTNSSSFDATYSNWVSDNDGPSYLERQMWRYPLGGL